MAKRAICYARVSYADKEGENLEGQLRMCREYAEREGFTVVHEVTEDQRGASGADIDLPGIDRILELARKGLFDVLIVREVDRFSRDMPKFFILQQELKRDGVEIKYALYDFPDTPEGQLRRNFFALLADYERAKTIERTTRGRRRRVQDGNVSVSGLPPLGFYELVDDRNHRRLEINEDEACIVRNIFTWYTRGDESGVRLTISGIARKLSNLGVPTYTEIRTRRIKPKKRGPGQWNRSVIHRILTNPVYVGRWQYGKYARRNGKYVKNDPALIIEITVPPIVSEETWQETQRRLESNREKRRGRKPIYDYLMSKHIQCGRCGYRVGAATNTHPAKEHIYFYYRCRSDDTAATGCDMPQFRADHVDRAVWERLKTWLTNPDMLLRFYEEDEAERVERNALVTNELLSVDEELAQLEVEETRLSGLYLRGNFSLDILDGHKARQDARRKRLETKKVALGAQLEGLIHPQKEQIFQTVEDLREARAEADRDFGTRRRIIEVLDTEIVFRIDDGQKMIGLDCSLFRGRDWFRIDFSG